LPLIWLGSMIMIMGFAERTQAYEYVETADIYGKW